MAIKKTDAGTIFTGSHIRLYRLVTLKSALKLEIKGIRVRRNFSAYSTLKNELGLRGSRERVLEQVEAILREATINKEYTDKEGKKQ